nr:restriction endonuclease subunit S [uncultured Methanobrevibacter sp.]
MADVFSGVRLSRYDDEYSESQVVIHKTYSDDFLKFDCESRTVSDNIYLEKFEKYFSKENDIIVSLFDPTRVTKITKKGLIIPDRYAIIRLHENIDPDFMVLLLKSSIFRRELNKLIEGSFAKYIRTRYIQEVKLPIPDYENQKKYGKLLKLLEDKIQLKLKSIENNKKAQKALLDKLVRNY